MIYFRIIIVQDQNEQQTYHTICNRKQEQAERSCTLSGEKRKFGTD